MASATSERGVTGEEEPARSVYNSYLPGRGDTMIKKYMTSATSERGMTGEEEPVRSVYNSYLPGRGDTMIKKVVHPGRGSAIALRLC